MKIPARRAWFESTAEMRCFFLITAPIQAIIMPKLVVLQSYFLIYNI